MTNRLVLCKANGFRVSRLRKKARVSKSARWIYSFKIKGGSGLDNSAMILLMLNTQQLHK